MLDSLYLYALAVVGWAQAHPLFALGVAVSVLGTLANSLTHFPRAQAFVVNVAAFLAGLLRFLLDVSAIIAKADGRGLAGPLTLPGVPTLPAKTALLPRGFSVIAVLAFLAIVGILLGVGALRLPVVIGAAALAVLVCVLVRYRGTAALVLAVTVAGAAGAQQLPEDRAFGGCSPAGNFCARPETSIFLAGFDASSGKVIGGIIPGAGYGVEFFANKWHRVGLALYASVQTGGDQGTQALLSGVASFARYVRIGVARQIAGDQHHTLLLLGFGSDFGAPASAGGAQ